MPQYDLRLDGAKGMLESPGVMSATLTVTNNGQVTPANFDLTFTAEGFSYVATVSEVPAPALAKEVKVVMNDVPDGVGFDKPITVTVSRIEGGEDAVPGDNDRILGVKVKRNVVVEEFTGTGCGWCPRGLVGM